MDDICTVQERVRDEKRERKSKRTKERTSFYETTYHNLDKFMIVVQRDFVVFGGLARKIWRVHGFPFVPFEHFLLSQVTVTV